MNTDIRDWFTLTEVDCGYLEQALCYPACDTLAQLARIVTDAGLTNDSERIKSRIRLLITAEVPLNSDVPDTSIQITTTAQVATERIMEEAINKGWSELELFGESNDYRQLSFAQLFIDGSSVLSVDEDKITIMTPTGIKQHVWKHGKY